jgi:hypothetical protein
VLLAHHDAVPQSPGANDNAAAVAILLTLLERWAAREPARVRVRLMFPACEELGYLVRACGCAITASAASPACSAWSCRAWATAWPCGTRPTRRRSCARCGARSRTFGLRADESYHVVGRIPVFGSDHRAFADAGVPAYGLTTVPAHEVPALRQFIFSPLRTMFRGGGRRPKPFDTYTPPATTGARWTRPRSTGW